MPLSPKEYLMQLKHLDKEIDSNIKAMNELKDRAESIGTYSTGDKVQSSSNVNFSDWVNKIVDLEKNINQRIDDLVALKNTISEQINKINNPLYRLVLVNHYIRDMRLYDIACNYNYNYSYLRHVHGLALLEFKKCNPEVFNDSE